MSNPLVSIIIPTYNRAHLIGETLDSIVAQTYTHWECIIVDDGSTDNTDELVKEYVAKDPRFQYHKRPDSHKPGGNGARNFGFEVSKGRFIVFLDSDDFLEEFCLQNRVEKNINIHKNEVLVFCMGVFREGVKTQEILNNLNSSNYLETFFKGKIPWTINCVFWQRELFVEIGKFDEDFLRLQDVDLHIRLLLNGNKIVLINEVDSWYRFSATHTSSKKLTKAIIVNSHVKLIKKFYDKAFLDFNLRNSIQDSIFRILNLYVFRVDGVFGFKNIIQLQKEFSVFSKKGFLKLRLLDIFIYKTRLYKISGVYTRSKKKCIQKNVLFRS